ncbi:DUF3833 domain-containing protein [Paludibacterium sp. THUN1379]|uniref:DUF3833 domain-containing protein n=1 Tax=Paludibacterium sp. THUN1379 TaxID=3112107 RepID=UPI003089474E|nr:DUF3833 domain-containing protein [Paludibacterium sp. THUN1379]
MKRLIVLLAVWLTGCAAPDIHSYQQDKPALDPARFFLGDTQAWGMFQQRDGRVLKRFTVQIHGRMEGEQLVLDEHFLYSDGTTQQRTWRLRAQGNGQWRGNAADVVGDARGEAAGNALHWRYRLQLPEAQSGWQVDFDDWMFLIDDQTMVNRATMSKFGIRVGEVTLFFRKGG